MQCNHFTLYKKIYILKIIYKLLLNGLINKIYKEKNHSFNQIQSVISQFSMNVRW